MNYSSLGAILEGLDISTSPASNAGAPFTGTAGPNTSMEIGVEFNPKIEELGLHSIESVDLSKFSAEQEKLLEETLSEFGSVSNENYDFVKLIDSITSN